MSERRPALWDGQWRVQSPAMDALSRAPKRACEAPGAGTGPSYILASALKILSSTYTHQNKTRHAAQRGGGARAEYMRRRRDELRKRPRHRCLPWAEIPRLCASLNFSTVSGTRRTSSIPPLALETAGIPSIPGRRFAARVGRPFSRLRVKNPEWRGPGCGQGIRGSRDQNGG